MPKSPIVAEMEYLSIEISTNGKKIKDEYDVLSVEVARTVSRTARANFSLLLPDGGEEDRTFEISSGKDLLPGSTVEIKVGYSSSSKIIFKGKIVGHGLRARPGERPVLKLRCQSSAAQLTVHKKTTAFEEMTDSALINKVLTDAGISNKKVDTTSYNHPQLIQHRMTDWDFILSRAAANGMIVFSEFDEVLVKAPETSLAPDLEISYQRDVFEFEGEVDAGHQFASVAAEGWDFVTGKAVKGVSKEPKLNKQGNLTGKKLAAGAKLEEEVFSSTLAQPQAPLKTLAEAMLLQSRLSALRGRVSFFGSASPKLNTLIRLKGFGDRFNGDALITSVRHTIQEGRWITETGFGLPPDWSAAIVGGRASNPNEASQIRGLQNGVVTNIHEDPDKHARIKVSIPVLGTEVWARQSTIYATDGQGAFFVPEVGDEVVLGFLANDPRFAIILGSLPGPKHKSAYVADEKNKIKALTTKAKLKLEMNDEDKIFTITTPGNNIIVLSDKDKSIVLTDEHKNEITMDKAGIKLKSSKDIVLDATGKISIKAKQAIDAASAGGDVSLKGNNVSGDGKIGVKMKGGATAELSAGGQTTVKGAMVMIN